MKQEYQRFYHNTNENRGNRRREVRNKRRKKNDPKRLAAVAILVCSVVLVLCAVFFSVRHLYLQMKKNHEKELETTEEIIQVPPLSGVAAMFPELPISEEFLTVNSYSRPGIALTTNPQYIVIHYTANPGSTARQNRDYFENLKDTQETYASSQFVIGLEGEIIQCVPCNEIAYCSNHLNEISISIEMCHPDEGGNFNDATYNNCVYLVAKLMNYYNLDMDHLIRHYDVTGKNCPKYFVEHGDRWEVFKGFVEEYREKYQKEQR
ncbi:MAG: peptidoglycan recognition protein family protein [Lachnospiraceae bacterium]|nr:peptidoglycan recognition protein family protein [Lachnospiraceae bacterium]